MTQNLCQHGPVARIAQNMQRFARGHPMRRMSRLGGGAAPKGGVCDIDRADLFGPKAIIRHVAKPAKGTEPPGAGDVPAGFFHHLAVQGGQRVFARINAAAGQLELVIRFCLMSQQNVIAPQQNAVDTGAAAIGLIRHNGLAIASDHSCPLGAAVALTI